MMPNIIQKLVLAQKPKLPQIPKIIRKHEITLKPKITGNQNCPKVPENL